MNVATLVSVSVSTLGYVFAAGLWAVSGAPGMRGMKALAASAAFGASYGLTNACLSSGSFGLASLAVRFAVLFVGLHAGAWLVFSARREDRRLYGWEKVLLAGIGVFGVLGFVPNLLYHHDEPWTHEISWLGITYIDTRSTWVGNLSFVYFVFAVSLLGARAFARIRRGDKSARAELVGIVALLVSGINDSFVSSGALAMPYLLDVGYLVMIAAISLELAREFVRNARDLQAAQAALVRKERLAALGEMSAVVAHEVRNPVAIIFNAVAGLRKRPDDPDKLLAIVEEEAERLKRMVSDLLEFARPASLVLDDHAVRDIVAGAVEALRTASPGAPVDVDVELPEELPALRCDARLMRQAVINLLANALAAPRRTRAVTVVASAEGEHVAIRVVDDGGGVEASAVESIFSPFFTTRATGTGLGLPVVKRIAEAHGGRVSLENRPGVGATFVLSVPAKGPRVADEA
ncbi:MAG: ATP-binding protein [Polyangiaceae bacterium]